MPLNITVFKSSNQTHHCYSFFIIHTNPAIIVPQIHRKQPLPVIYINTHRSALLLYSALFIAKPSYPARSTSNISELKSHLLTQSYLKCQIDRNSHSHGKSPLIYTIESSNHLVLSICQKSEFFTIFSQKF